jgi:hypothetical protein
MMLEDGFWRVRHFVKMKPEALLKTPLSHVLFTLLRTIKYLKKHLYHQRNQLLP